MVKSKETIGEIPYRTLGRTGERVSVIGIGGFHLAKPGVDEQLSLRIVRSAVDRGINFMDNCWDYNEGASEERMGKALRDGYRDKVFLMTKIDGRSRQEAARQLDQSLQRLKTDCIDLVQFHEIIRYDDPTRIFDPEGAHATLLEARQAGKIRYIGFTGHKDPQIHLYMLEVADKHDFSFDAVQMPLNVMDAHFRSFEKHVLPELVRRNIGVLAMKTLSGGNIIKTGKVSATECLHYALNLPTSVVITGIDSMEILDQAVKVASSYRPMSKDQVAALLAKTEDIARTGEYEPFKTHSIYDGTALNPHWLGEEPARIQDMH